MKYNLDVVEAMAKAQHKRLNTMWPEPGLVEEWDELSKDDYLDWMDDAIASLDALVKACPEVAQYVTEAPP